MALLRIVKLTPHPADSFVAEGIDRTTREQKVGCSFEGIAEGIAEGVVDRTSGLLEINFGIGGSQLVHEPFEREFCRELFRDACQIEGFSRKGSENFLLH